MCAGFHTEFARSLQRISVGPHEYRLYRNTCICIDHSSETIYVKLLAAFRHIHKYNYAKLSPGAVRAWLLFPGRCAMFTGHVTRIGTYKSYLVLELLVVAVCYVNALSCALSVFYRPAF